jgi:hypothetical protein
MCVLLVLNVVHLGHEDTLAYVHVFWVSHIHMYIHIYLPCVCMYVCVCNCVFCIIAHMSALMWNSSAISISVSMSMSMSMSI